MKVVGVGLGKTGTTTLARCLKQLGYRHRSWNRDIYDAYARGDMRKIMEVVDAYDSFDDHPWPSLYREIDTRHPGSKFILTVRKDPETWLRSLETKTHRRAERTRVWHIFGMKQGEFDAEKARQHYMRHNEEIRAYFKDRPNDFLELCWDKGDGWDKLATFLDKPVPQEPFPHANKTRGDREFALDELKQKLVPRVIKKMIDTH
jgi:Sulfotransferase domain